MGRDGIGGMGIKLAAGAIGNIQSLGINRVCYSVLGMGIEGCVM
jgi:hypothetical protein